MKLDNYNFSYANHVGNVLKRPLAELVVGVALALAPKPHEKIAERVAKIFFRVILAIILVIPAGMAWLLGKAIILCSKTQIDHDQLALTPPPIQLPDVTNLMHDRLLEKFNVYFPGIEKNRQEIEHISNSISNWRPDPDSANFNKHELLNREMKIFLTQIIKKMDAYEVSDDEARTFLTKLADLSTRCPETWHEVIAQFYAQIYDGWKSAIEKLLKMVQDYKEGIILEFGQLKAGTEWHVINFVRNQIGDEVGLNTKLGENDQWASGDDPIFGKSLTKWIFMQTFEDANRMVQAITTAINQGKYDPVFQDLILETIKAKGMEKAEDLVAEHFFTEDYKIKECGVNLMLKEIRILKSVC